MPPPTASAGRSGLWSALTHLTAGLAGGLLVLLAGEAVAPQLGFGPSGGDAVRNLEGRVAAVESATRATSASSSAELTKRLATAEQRIGALDQMRQKVGEIDERQTALAKGAKALEDRITQPGADSVTARVAKLEDTLKALVQAANDPQAGRVPQLAQMTARLSEIESTLTNQIVQLRKSVVQDVEARVAGATEASEAARNATERLGRDVAQQKADSARLGLSVESLRIDVGQQIKGLTRPGDVTAAVGPVADRVAKLERSVDAVEKSEADRQGTAERILLALELGNLKRAVERGAPYATELAEVQRAGGDKLNLAALQRFKDKGVPTNTALQKDFRDIVYRVIDADAPAEGGGIVDRLLASAKSVVRVRKVDGAASDDGVEAVTARMEAALKEGDLTEVVALADRLSPNARKVAEPWLERVEASAQVDRAITRVERELKQSLGSAAGKRG